MTRINFGKHNGKDITTVPANYLEWMISARTRQAADARKELVRRSVPALGVRIAVATAGYVRDDEEGVIVEPITVEETAEFISEGIKEVYAFCKENGISKAMFKSEGRRIVAQLNEGIPSEALYQAIIEKFGM